MMGCCMYSNGNSGDNRSSITVNRTETLKMKSIKKPKKLKLNRNVATLVQVKSNSIFDTCTTLKSIDTNIVNNAAESTPPAVPIIPSRIPVSSVSPVPLCVEQTTTIN